MIRFLTLPAALLLAIAAQAAEPAPQGVLTRQPAVIEKVDPEYPPDAQAAGLTAEVPLELTVSETGEVVDVTVLTPAGHGFDEAALAAARKLRFSPAEVDGEPASVRIEYRFRFELEAAPTLEAPPPVNLRGQVLERGTRRPVAGVAIDAGGQTTHTDKDGRFELAGVPLGKVKVIVLDSGYQKFQVEETIDENQVTEVKYWLLKRSSGAYEAVVIGERDKREVSRVAISAGEISRVAGVSGDAVKVVLNLPGVARSPFGLGQLVIRGGNPRDTRVYIDDIEVPLVFHFGGLTSVYSSDLIEKVEFEPGNFGVRTGHATGGRVNLVTRDPSDRTHLVADVNLYQATLLAEFRLSDKVGISLAGRRSYADFMINLAQDSEDSEGGSFSLAPRYYDFQAKLTWTPTSKDKVRFDFFGSDDRMVMTGIETDSLVRLDRLGYGTAFYQLAANWDHRFDEATRMRLQLGQGWIIANIGVGDIYSEKDRVSTTSLRAEITRDFGPALSVSAGLDSWVRPNALVEVSAPNQAPEGQIQSYTVDDAQQRGTYLVSEKKAAGWAEATLKPLDRLTIVPGIRYDYFDSITNLSWVDPRLAVRLAVGEATVLKAAAGLYHQPPPYAFLTEEWGNPDLKPEGAWQYSIGAEHRLLSHLFIDLQLYYKRLFDLAAPTDALVDRGGNLVPVHFTSDGTGKAYGAELLLRWDPDGRFFGWIAYSLSRTKRDSNGSSMGEDDGSDYDQPHNLVAVGTFELPEIWTGLSAGFRLRYTSGSPYERIKSAIYDGDMDAYQAIETGKNNARMPPFFQLDLRVDRKWTFKTWTLSTYVDLQNVTFRKNAEFPMYNYDYSKSGFVTGIPFFPSFGVKAEY